MRKAYGVDLKRVPPKSRQAPQHHDQRSRTSQKRRKARKDPAVHVSLPSDSLVKQHAEAETSSSLQSGQREREAASSA
jgi:hypothetical protein